MILSPRFAKLALPVSGALLVILSVVALGTGDIALSPARAWDGLLGHDELATTVMQQIRVPRLLVAMLTGAGLSAAGLIMQAYFRNSLASPGLLGVSSGGAAGAVIAIAAGATFWVTPVAAVLGAFLATGAVVMLAQRGAGTERLLLAGVALNALLGAVTSYVLSRFIGQYERNTSILFWLLGGLDDRTWEHVIVALPVVLAGIVLLFFARPMDLLSLGEAEAQSLGVDVRFVRGALIVLSTVLAAVSTAVAGAIGFVGLVVPHILRLLVGPGHKRLVPLSLVGGAAFVVACDLVCRAAGGLRLGIVTALIGGPFFLWLLRRKPA